MRLCLNCAGSGKVVGGGMLTQDCDACNGFGKITVKEIKPTEVLSDAISFENNSYNNNKTHIDKRSKAYRESVKRMQKATDKSKEEIETLLDKELSK